MICFPNSKINLGLNVIEKRPDGFHNIETVFYPIPLCDVLEVSLVKNVVSYRFSSSGIPVNIETKDNIVVKAFNLLASKFHIPPTAIHLHKNIPLGAGLGGGSADAAYMIKMLNENFSLNLSCREMQKLAEQLGSDCPFFIQNTPAFAQGKGEILSPVNLSLKGYYLLLIKPKIHISTSEAYAKITPKQPKQSLKELIQLPLEKWRESVNNDFEKSIFPNHPLLADLKAEMYQSGAIYAAMSGSGSTIYGLFSQKPETKESWKTHFTWIKQL